MVRLLRRRPCAARHAHNLVGKDVAGKACCQRRLYTDRATGWLDDVIGLHFEGGELEPGDTGDTKGLQRGIGGFQLCRLQYITHATTTLLMKPITRLFLRLAVLTNPALSSSASLY